MSLLSELGDGYQRFVSKYLDFIKVRVFGANNEHLDFVMDSFYKLAPQQRNGVVVGLVALIILFVFGAFFLYASRVGSLERELNQSFAALHEFQVLKVESQLEDEKFDKLLSTIKRKTKRLNFKPFFEKLSREHKVTIKGIGERTVDVDPNNPLASRIKEVQVEMKLPKISIPRLLKFLVAIEKSGHYLRIQDLKITGMYGNRLYFDTNVLVRGYSTI